MAKIDYNSVASSYARHRGASGFVLAELDRGSGLSPESKVLEVGCGTGNYIAEIVALHGCRGWGIDPSNEMLRRAPRMDRLQFQLGTSPDFGLPDGVFDFVFSVNVIHHVQDTLAHFREAYRVLRAKGVICTVTDSEEIIRKRRPLSEYWPETVKADLKRYPPISHLRDEMAELGFTAITERVIQQTMPVTDAAPYRDKAFSCLHLIPEEAFQAGLRRLQQDLAAGPVAGWSGYVCLWGRVP